MKLQKKVEAYMQQVKDQKDKCKRLECRCNLDGQLNNLILDIDKKGAGDKMHKSLHKNHSKKKIVEYCKLVGYTAKAQKCNVQISALSMIIITFLLFYCTCIINRQLLSDTAFRFYFHKSKCEKFSNSANAK